MEAKATITRRTSELSEYRVWRGMVDRCTRSNHPAWVYYGGRGIRVCDPWLGPGGFARFYRDVGVRPSGLHTLDRINNDGDYEPANVRWALPDEQSQNRRASMFGRVPVMLTAFGVTKAAHEWAAEFDVCPRKFVSMVRNSRRKSRVRQKRPRRADVVRLDPAIAERIESRMRAEPNRRWPAVDVVATEMERLFEKHGFWTTALFIEHALGGVPDLGAVFRDQVAAVRCSYTCRAAQRRIKARLGRATYVSQPGKAGRAFRVWGDGDAAAVWLSARMGVTMKAVR